jgi:flagellar biosynthesis protein FlhF
MKLKSYFAETVEQAISRASRELGPEAMLVYSREAHPEARYLGSYEVVFAAPVAAPSETPAVAPPPPPRIPTPPIAASQAESSQIVPPKLGPGPAGTSQREGGNGRMGAARTPPRKSGQITKLNEDATVEKLSQELAVMRRQMDRMMTAFARGSAPPHSGSPAGVLAALDPLIEAGISQEIVDRLASRLGELPESGVAGTETLRRELSAMFSVDARLGCGTGPRFVALVGPPGSGKTTTLVKLAVAYGLKSRKPVQLISMDTWRVGGADQLRCYAGILGVGFQALETAGALAQALEEHRHKDLVLIDTPGLSEKELDAADELASFLRSRPDVDTHLTLTSSMKSADLTTAVDRYERFRPAKLLFTRLDETSSLGTILNEAVRTGKPVSFLANGQRIPEDLEEATQDHILDLILADWNSEWPAQSTERQAAAA